MATVVGVIGVGNMGSGMVKGWLRAAAGREPGTVAGDPGVVPDLIVWDKMETAAQSLVAHAGPEAPLSTADSLEQLVTTADVILVVVKPKDAQEVLASVGRLIGAEQAVVSAMAGLRLETLRGFLGTTGALFRIMPNLGVEVGAGAVALAAEPGLSTEQWEKMLDLFRPLGPAEIVPEELFDAVTAVSGSSPAFMAVALEGLEDGAVAAGLGRAEAQDLVRRAALETAQELSDCAESPAEMRQRLLAEGQLGAEAAAVLEERKVRAAFRGAVEAALERSRQMGQA